MSLPPPDSELAVAAVFAWTPWVGTAAAASVYADGGQGTVFGMEPTGISVVILALTAVAWVALTAEFDLDRATRLFVGGGAGVLFVLVGYGAATATPAVLGWLALATLLAGVFAAIAWRRLADTTLPTSAQSLGTFVVFAQALDGTTTAVGIDVLGYGEQSPLSAAILTAAAEWPLATHLGAGWVFVTIKVLLAFAFVTVLLGDRAPSWRSAALLGLTAFVGLGPAVHNVVLFTTTA